MNYLNVRYEKDYMGGFQESALVAWVFVVARNHTHLDPRRAIPAAVAAVGVISCVRISSSPKWRPGQRYWLALG